MKVHISRGSLGHRQEIEVSRFEAGTLEHEIAGENPCERFMAWFKFAFRGETRSMDWHTITGRLVIVTKSRGNVPWARSRLKNRPLEAFLSKQSRTLAT